jgi:glycosyltransferase involved in cell wall biosynthesis
VASKKEKIKPRVLFITRCYPPAVGGMERFAKDLHDALAKETDQVTLSWGGSKKALIFVLPYFFIKSCLIVARNNIEVIHAQDGVVSIFATLVGKLFKKPVVVVIHGLDATYSNGLYQYLIRHSLKRSERIICISQAAKDEVVKRGINSRNVVVIPLGMTDELFDKTILKKQINEVVHDLPENPKILLSVGRLVKRKGIVWFLNNVMPEIIKKESSSILVVCGKGPEKEEIEKAIKSLKISKNVRLIVSVTDEQLKILYNSADCFVMPNIPVAGDMEGFGRVLLEAALCELPVVASDLEGIKEAITNNKNGILCTPEDSQAHSRTIIGILRDKSGAKLLGSRARQYTLKNYSWPLIAQHYLDQYTSLIQKDTK